MYAGTFYVECCRNGMGRGGVHERFGRGLGCNLKLVTQPLCQCCVVSFCRTSIAGKQETADQMPTIHLAQRIELDKAASVSCRGKMFAGGILVLHEAFQAMHEPPPERFAAKERPILEFGTIGEAEARDEVSPITLAGFLEGASVTGTLEQMRIDL